MPFKHDDQWFPPENKSVVAPRICNLLRMGAPEKAWDHGKGERKLVEESTQAEAFHMLYS